MGAEEIVRSKICFVTDNTINRMIRIAHSARRRIHEGMPEAYFIRQVTIRDEMSASEISTYYVDVEKLQRIKEELHTFTSMLSLCRDSMRDKEHDFRSNVLKMQKLYPAFIDAHTPTIDSNITIAITGVSEDNSFARNIVEDSITALGFALQYSKW